MGVREWLPAPSGNSGYHIRKLSGRLVDRGRLHSTSRRIRFGDQVLDVATILWILLDLVDSVNCVDSVDSMDSVDSEDSVGFCGFCGFC